MSSPKTRQSCTQRLEHTGSFGLAPEGQLWFVNTASTTIHMQIEKDRTPPKWCLAAVRSVSSVEEPPGEQAHVGGPGTGRSLKNRQQFSTFTSLGPSAEAESLGSLKEVIQPQVPLRLPCYDFTPIIDQTVGASLPWGWVNDFGSSQLSWCDGRCVQGPGTYSPRHSDPRLLAIPTSWSRVADSNPNCGDFFGIGSISRYCYPL